MATFKAVIYKHHKKEDDSFNVKIRVIHKRVIRYIPTSIYVFKSDLTKSLKIKNLDITDKLDSVIKKYIRFSNKLGTAIDMMNVDDVINHIKAEERREFENKNQYVDFVDYTNKMVLKMEKAGKKSTADNYRYMLNSLSRFRKGNIFFSDITVKFLTDYENFLVNNGTGARGLSLYMGLIRAVFNDAIRELNDYENDIIKIKGSPFVKYKIKKEPTPAKRSINIEKLIDLFFLPYTGGLREDLAKDMFILSFYLIGMNSADLYHCKDLEDGRITYKRKKTASRREDEAEISVKIPESINYICEKYKDRTGQRVFNFYHTYSTTGIFNKAINKGLKSIGEKIGIPELTFYAARHTFASIARNNCSLSMDYISQALNHSSGHSVTDLYIRKDWSVVDNVQQTVLQYVFIYCVLKLFS